MQRKLMVAVYQCVAAFNALLPRDTKHYITLKPDFFAMKRLILPVIIGLLFSLTTVSCGSNKVAKASYPEYTAKGSTGTRTVTKVKEEIDECEQEALNAPAGELRAYASAVDEDRDFARQQAVLFAKANLVDQIESLVLNVMKGYRGKIKANGKSSSEADIRQDAGSMAERVVENCRIICSNRYRMSDGTYECVVCISVPSDNAEKVAGATALSDDERLGVEFHEQEFRNSYREELERFREMQKERK